MALSRIGLQEGTNKESSFTQYKHWVDFYSKKSGINIQIDDTLPAPAAVPDNSQNDIPTIIINPTLLKGKIHLDDEGVLQVLFHEIEHLKEDTILKSTSQGKNIATQRIQRFEKLQETGLTKTYHELENMIRDIYVNNQVIDIKNTPILESTLRKNYREHFAKHKDFLKFPVHNAEGKIVSYTKLPKHTQFGYAMLREAMLSDEQCIIDPDVRKAITRLQKSGILQKASTGSLADRLQIIWKFIEPTYTRFLDEDIKKQEEKDNDEKNNTGNQNKDQNANEDQSGEQKQQNTPKKGDQQGNKQSKDQKNTSSDSQNNTEEGKNENNTRKSTAKEKTSQKKKSTLEKIKDSLKNTLEGKQTEEHSNGKKEQDNISDNQNVPPKNPFDDIYNQLPSSPHLLEDALSSEEYEKIQQAIKKQVEKELAPKKTAKQLEIEHRVDKIIEKDKSKDRDQLIKELSEYDKFYDQLQKVRNPHTGNTVIEDIEQLFRYIKSQRLKPQLKTRGPVDIEHGIGKLHNPSIAIGIADLLSGNIEAPMREESEKKERSKNHIGRFDITVVGDGSGSMEGEKNRQQKINILLIFEALKRLHDMLDSEKRDLAEPLEFHTEGYLFKDYAHGVDYIKEISDDFTDEQRLKAYSALDYEDGLDTNDYDALALINKNIDEKPEQYRKDILEKKLKKIVFILTDGGSSNAPEATKEIIKLREKGVLVYGIGITNSGEPVLSLFGKVEDPLGFGKVCHSPEELAAVILDLLSPHLKGQ